MNNQSNYKWSREIIILILIITLANFIFIIKINYTEQQNKIFELENRILSLEDLYWNNL